MPDPIFERYKEALRAGHVAALRGRLDDALVQYRQASSIAPDRPLPHASMAEVLTRLGRRDDALAACARALSRGPGDQAVLETAARVYADAGEAGEAASCFDRLATVLSAGGRVAAARDAAARARDLQPTASRQARLDQLVREAEAVPAEAGPTSAASEPARGGPPDTTPPAALDATGQAEAPAPPEVSDEAMPAVPSPPGAADLAGEEPSRREPAGHAEAPEPEDVAAPDASALEVTAPHATGAHATGAHATGAHVAGTDAATSPDPEAAFMAADELAAAGDPREAARIFAVAAGAYLAAGAPDTAIDACLRALAGAPGETEVHLALARIHVASGRRDRVEEKLRLLERLLELEDASAARERVAAFRQEVLGDT